MNNPTDPILEYWNWLLSLPLPYRYPNIDITSKINERGFVHDLFPFIITIEDTLLEIEKLENWCYNNFGSKFGNKYYYEKKENKNHLDNDYVNMSSETPNIKTTYETGEWTTILVLKTNYNYGFCDFCFKQEEQALYFNTVHIK